MNIIGFIKIIDPLIIYFGVLKYISMYIIRLIKIIDPLIMCFVVIKTLKLRLRDEYFF